MTVRLKQLAWPGCDIARALAQADVVVCTASLLANGDDGAASLAALNAAERARFSGYGNDIVARRFLEGRRALRDMLASVLGVASSDVPIREGLHGKPYLAAGTANSLWFSVSHTDELLVVAMSRTADVGVDVERSRDFDQWHRVAERVLDPHERRQLAAAVESGVDPGVAFLRHWCRVEAELKAVGCGIQGLDAHRAGVRPRGLRLVDLAALLLPPELAVPGVRYQAAVALCAPGATYDAGLPSARHASSAAHQAAKPTPNPASASTP